MVWATWVGGGGVQRLSGFVYRPMSLWASTIISIQTHVHMHRGFRVPVRHALQVPLKHLKLHTKLRQASNFHALNGSQQPSLVLTSRDPHWWPKFHASPAEAPTKTEITQHPKICRFKGSEQKKEHLRAGREKIMHERSQLPFAHPRCSYTEFTAFSHGVPV